MTSLTRVCAAVDLRRAALTLLHHKGELAADSFVYEQHALEAPEPRLSLRRSTHPFDGHFMLNAWANLKGKHTKVFNIGWHRPHDIRLVRFRRGEWEGELLAMAAMACRGCSTVR